MFLNNSIKILKYKQKGGKNELENNFRIINFMRLAAFRKYRGNASRQILSDSQERRVGLEIFSLRPIFFYSFF